MGNAPAGMHEGCTLELTRNWDPLNAVGIQVRHGIYIGDDEVIELRTDGYLYKTKLGTGDWGDGISVKVIQSGTSSTAQRARDYYRNHNNYGHDWFSRTSKHFARTCREDK